MENLENDNKWNVLQIKLQERNVCNAFKYFRDNSVEPILIKGLASARWYPSEIGRASVDVDLCVSEDEFDICQNLINSNPPARVSIDLHRGLRYLDPMPWKILFENSELVEIDGVGIRQLCPEDHLRVLCTHWLTDGGENKQRLWDIFYLVDRKSGNFDWDKCLNVVSENRRRWVVYTIGLAHYYLGLDISGLPFEKEVKETPKWFRKVVERNWEKGIPIIPLKSCKHDRKIFWQQLKKRFPPNPIFATVSMEGSLDAKTRLHYQFGNFFMRSMFYAKGITPHFLGFKRK